MLIATRAEWASTATFVFTLTLGATAAHACIGCMPDRYAVIPGMTFVRPDMVVLLPILSGTLERPFYALAGYRDPICTLAFSIQANLLASLAVLGISIVGLMIAYDVGVLLGAVATPIVAVLVKRRWFRRVPREAEGGHVTIWFAVATLASTFVIATIPVWMAILGTDTQRYAAAVAAFKAPAIPLVLAASLITHVVCFVRFRRAAAFDARRGFEVKPLGGPVAG